MGSPQILDALAFLALALLLTKVVGRFVGRFGIPDSITELLTGIMLGNIGRIATNQSSGPWSSDGVFAFSTVGALMIVFVAGLQTDMRNIMKRFGPAARLAIICIAAAFIAAFVALPLVLTLSFNQRLAMAALLMGTSLAILSRSLLESEQLNTTTGYATLGAAVLINTVGIVILALVQALMRGGQVLAQTAVLALLQIACFFLAVVLFRAYVLRPFVSAVQRLELSGGLTVLTFCVCVLCAWTAQAAGVISIIGVFALGVALDDATFQGKEGTSTATLETLIRSLTDLFMPIAFITMGMRIDLASLAQMETLTFAAAFFFCAIGVKLATGIPTLKAYSREDYDRVVAGFGMLSYGEVGLIFAAVAMQANLFNGAEYSALSAAMVLASLPAPLLIAKKSGHRTPKTRIGSILQRPGVWVALAPFAFLLFGFGRFLYDTYGYSDKARSYQAQVKGIDLREDVVIALMGDNLRIKEAFELFAARKPLLLVIPSVPQGVTNAQDYANSLGARVDLEGLTHRVLLSSAGFTTFGEAKVAKQLLQNHPFQRMILVTSDFTMPRAVTIFESVFGLVDIVPYSVPSALNGFSLALSNDGLNGIGFLWQEYWRNIIWKVYLLYTRLKF